MKLPNSYGSVYKLSGSRRNPYRAVVTLRWVLDKDTSKPKQIRKTLGYYKTKSDALCALADYNKCPYDIGASKTTLQEVYERWSVKHFPNISHSNILGYKASYLLCEPLYKKRMADIKLDDLQYIVDTSGKNEPTLRKFKTLIKALYKYAIIHDIISADMDKSSYIDIHNAGNPNAINREPFTSNEIQLLWDIYKSNVYYNVILILIYTGVRISELLDLKKENVNLKERWFNVTESKTTAGVRKVPICKKVMPFFEYWYNLNNSDYLITTPAETKFEYRNYYDSYWKPLINQINLNHRPHDTRHTCASMLAEKGIDERIIKKILGHKGQGVTETVYTHFEIQTLLDAIDKL